MLVKYYLSDSIKASFEDFTLGLQNSWAFKTLGPAWEHTQILWEKGIT